MAGADTGALIDHVPGLTPVIKNWSFWCCCCCSEDRNLVLSSDCFLAPEVSATLSVSFLGVEVTNVATAAAAALLSLPAVFRHCNITAPSPFMDSLLLGGPGVATELLTLMLLLLKFHGESNPKLEEGVGGEKGNLRSGVG